MLVGGADDTEGGAVVDGGQGAGVAVVDEGRLLGDQREGVEADRLVGLDVLLSDGVGLGQDGLCDGFRGLEAPGLRLGRTPSVE